LANHPRPHKTKKAEICNHEAGTSIVKANE